MHNLSLNALIRRRMQVVQEENSAVTYTVAWGAFLNGDTISTDPDSSTWTTEDAGITIANEANDTLNASARFSGDPGRYRVVNKIVTAAGDTHERWLDIFIKDNSSGYQYDYGLIQSPR